MNDMLRACSAPSRACGVEKIFKVVVPMFSAIGRKHGHNHLEKE